nr:protein TRACHEARY ELEMENT DIFFERENTIATION-RELATED 7A-like [Procambarus clarkii]
MHFATELSGGDLRQRYRILNELYKVNNLPTFVIPEAMFIDGSSPPESDPTPEIPVNPDPIAPVTPAPKSCATILPPTSPASFTASSDDESNAYVEIVALSPPPAPEDIEAHSPLQIPAESPRVSALYDERDKHLTPASPHTGASPARYSTLGMQNAC